ncbi:MAG: Mur ligase family protein [bacterium]
MDDTSQTEPHVSQFRDELRKRPVRKNLQPVREAVRELELNTDATVVQVVGTNGKGSVVHYLVEYLSRIHDVVHFTSPHLVHPCERIGSNGQSISRNQFSELLLELPENYRENITPFEQLLLMVLHYQQSMDASYLVLEAGMGGRWDATSAIQADYTVLTAIEREHTQFLGETEREIVQEKTAQIPPGSTIVTGPMDEDIGKEVSKTIRERELTHVEADLKPSMHPLKRASRTAINVISQFDKNGDCLSEPVTSVPPGRQEFFKKNERTLFFDVAHTPRAVEASVSTLRHCMEKKTLPGGHPQAEKFNELDVADSSLIFGCMQGKFHKKLLERISTIFSEDRVVFTRVPSPRSKDPVELRKQWPDGSPSIETEPLNAINKLPDRGSEMSLLAVIGSFPLVGTLRQKITT